MKRITTIVFIAVLSGLITFGISNQLRKQKNTTERISMQPELLVPRQTAYNLASAQLGPDFRTAAKMSVDAVVHIRTRFEQKSSIYDDFYGSLRDFLYGNPHYQKHTPYVGYGSGVIIARDGYIVTNNHVVEGASTIEVTLNDKRMFEAKLVGTDPSTDLALIKIETENLPYLRYGNSDDVIVGEWVLAVGNPFNLTSTVTAGIVSAKARNINILGSSSAIESFIQTDAVVNRGNSGGALVNIKGELVGINAAIASQTGNYEGYSFAIPVNIVKKVMDDLLRYGEIQRAYIGITIREIDAEFAKELGIQQLMGVYVNSVSEGSGADKAGIKKGDIITQIDENDINGTAKLLEIVGQHRPGDYVKINILRDGKQKSFSVQLLSESGTIGVVSSNDEFEIPRLGASFARLTTKEQHSLHQSNGVKITKLEDGLLKNGGVRKGFVITRINNIMIDSKSDIEFALNNLENSLLKVEGVYPDGMRVIYGFEM